MLSSNQIRSSFIEFFEGKGHKFVPSWPVVPIGDDTLMFTNAGMNQFKDIFLGHTKPAFCRAVNSQKCIRVSGKHNDLEEVGIDTYHHTFFEMLGNWSFADYFKAEAIEWAWELLTKVYGIKAERLWTKVTSINPQRVLRFGRKDNFWEMGATGPCGPCSEIHIDLGADRCDKKNVPGHVCAVNAGCARFIELWNLVFIQFNRHSDGRLVPLGANYVDTGAGLERITAVLQDKRSNYDTDLFMPIIDAAARLTGHKYSAMLGDKKDNAFRVIADHVRSLVFSIADGVTVSNEGRGYVIRRILRRAARFGRVLDAHEPFMYKLVDVLAQNMGDAFPAVRERKDYIAAVIESEEAGFGRTLDRGLEIFESAAKNAKGKIISGEDAFQLYDTYGFPLDLTELLAREKALHVDTRTFDELMEQQRARARAAQKSTGSSVAFSGQVKLPAVDDSAKYQSDKCSACVIGWVAGDKFVEEGICEDSENKIGLVLDRTCFYAESGGQVCDVGTMNGQGWKFVVEAVEKYSRCVIHWGRLAEGKMRAGDRVEAIVDKNRQSTMKNHTATHLLQWALRQVLGESVKQQGSLVCPDYLRFDFTYPKALTKEEKEKVENMVREKIAEALPVAKVVMPIEQAKKIGAMALFGEKYGDEVRVVAVGAEGQERLNDALSKEFCGGTHVDNTEQIGDFAIMKEESVSAGVRRITALTGKALGDYLHQRSEIVDGLVEMLKVPAEQLTERVAKLLEDNKKLAKQVKSGAGGGGADVMAQVKKLLDNAEKIGESVIVAGVVSAGSVEQVRSAIDMVRKKAGSAATVLGFSEDDKVTLLAGVTDDLIKKGVRAGDIVKEIAPIVGGGGGGRPDMAQAGGKNPAKLNDAIEKAREFIKEKLIGSE